MLAKFEGAAHGPNSYARPLAWVNVRVGRESRVRASLPARSLRQGWHHKK
jgi:hypothetical protein